MAPPIDNHLRLVQALAFATAALQTATRACNNAEHDLEQLHDQTQAKEMAVDNYRENISALTTAVESLKTALATTPLDPDEHKG